MKTNYIACVPNTASLDTYVINFDEFSNVYDAE